MNPLKIIYVIPGDLWAGAESQVYYTLKMLNKISEFDVNIILFNKADLYNRLYKDGIDVHCVDENTNNGLHLCLWMRIIFKQECPDIVHVHGYKSHILTSLAKLISGGRFLIVRTIHGQLNPPVMSSNIKSFLLNKLEDNLLKSYTGLSIAVSKDIEDYMLERYRKSNIAYIHNAICIETENEDKASVDQRKKYDIPTDCIWIATAIRLVEVKNLGMLIRVAECLNDLKIENYVISVFGDGPLREELHERITSHNLGDRVIMHGHVDDILSVFQELDVFVLTSYSEGLPMSLLEAMYFGAVPVCTNVGGIGEVINDDCGFLINSDNHKQMATAINSLITNPVLMQKMSESSISRIKNHFSIDKMINDLAQAYLNLKDAVV